MSEKSKWVPLGKILREWGVRGQVRAVSYNPESTLFLEKNSLYLKEGDEFRPQWLEVAHQHGKFWLLKFQGIETPELAKNLRLVEIAVPREELAKPKKGEFYLADLEGLPVYAAGGEEIGKVEFFMPVGGAEVMRIRGPEGQEFLIPYRKEFVSRVSLKEGIHLTDDATAFL